MDFEEVERRLIDRSVPVAGRYGPWQLKSVSVAQYCLPTTQSTEAGWKLLQRPDLSSLLGDGWVLECRSGTPSERTMAILEEVVGDPLLEGEFFEWEAKSERVCVYWEEWGGSEAAARVVAYLDRLAASVSQDRRGAGAAS